MGILEIAQTHPHCFEIKLQLRVDSSPHREAVGGETCRGRGDVAAAMCCV